jgi:hypothetical protein
VFDCHGCVLDYIFSFKGKKPNKIKPILQILQILQKKLNIISKVKMLISYSIGVR